MELITIIWIDTMLFTKHCQEIYEISEMNHSLRTSLKPMITSMNYIIFVGKRNGVSPNPVYSCQYMA